MQRAWKHGAETGKLEMVATLLDRVAEKTTPSFDRLRLVLGTWARSRGRDRTEGWRVLLDKLRP